MKIRKSEYIHAFCLTNLIFNDAFQNIWTSTAQIYPQRIVHATMYMRLVIEENL